MFLQTGFGVLVGFSNRFRIFNFLFCKPSLRGLEIGTKLEWNLHKKILFYQKNKSNAPKNLELVKKKQVEPTKKSGACQKNKSNPPKNLELVKKSSRNREKIWSWSKKQVEPAKKD